MKPSTKRLLNVFAAILNIIVVLGFLFAVFVTVTWVPELVTHEFYLPDFTEYGARLLFGVVPIVVVCTVNYLVFGIFRVWNHILPRPSERNIA